MIEIRKPIFPKEHGLWAWVFLPLVVGAGCAEGNHYVMAPLLMSILGGFMFYTPARMAVKSMMRGQPPEINTLFWLAIYGAAALMFTLFTVTVNLAMLPYYGALAIIFFFAVQASAGGFQRSAFFEFGGLVFLSVVLSLLGACAVAGRVTMDNVAPWALTLLFMLERSIAARRVARLGGFIPALAQQSQKHAVTLRTVFMQNVGLAALAPLLALVIAQRLGAPLAPVAAFVPGLFVTLYFWRRPPAVLRTLGFAELFLAILFGALFISLWRL